jgi:hypothetical protein
MTDVTTAAGRSYNVPIKLSGIAFVILLIPARRYEVIIKCWIGKAWASIPALNKLSSIVVGLAQISFKNDSVQFFKLGFLLLAGEFVL